MAKYKVGTKVAPTSSWGGSFASGIVIAVLPFLGMEDEPNQEDSYLIEVTEAKPDGEGKAPGEIIRKSIGLLDRHYREVRDFFQVGKTYLFGSLMSGTKYLVVDLYENENPRGSRLQALMLATNSIGQTSYVAMGEMDFQGMVEFEEEYPF